MNIDNSMKMCDNDSTPYVDTIEAAPLCEGSNPAPALTSLPVHQKELARLQQKLGTARRVLHEIADTNEIGPETCRDVMRMVRQMASDALLEVDRK